MSAIEPTSRPQDEPPRSRLRAETPPPAYWRRWTADAPAEDPVTETMVSSDPPQPTTDTAGAPSMPASTADDAPARSGTGDAPYRILIVEDDRGQALFAQSVLHGAGMQAEVEMVPDGVMATIARFKPDLVLMDLHMPGQDGMTLTMQIRQRPDLLHMPIVFLTGDPDPEKQYEVLESGADDFLTKPIRPRHLIAAVSNRIQRSRKRTPAAATQLGVNPETGLPTRAHLMQQLGNALEAQTPGGLFFIEVSGALGLRERYGYASFENLMAEAGRQLALAAAPHPLARLNDNSFLALAKDLDADAQANFARGLRERLGQHDFVVRGDQTVRLGGAVGYAELPHTFSDTGSALEATERAALQAHQQSSGIAVYVPPQALEGDAGLSLADADLELAYQPIVSVAGSNLAQYQVFLRMRQADGTLVAAAQAVPAAELAGRIVELDRQVMERVLDLLLQYQNDGKSLRLFVSQSPRSLARDAFADWLLETLATRAIEGTSLIIDLRLDDALIHSVTLRQFCNRLMAAGVQFCLSQFEPGREAEALLTQLPLGYLRVSKRYATSHNDPELRDQLRGMIDLAHRMGLQVIGQQIEDPQAAAAMWMGGVDFIQGNLVQSVGSDLGFDFHNAVL
ncbi:MAG: EAL domain-containing protein [Pseudoxanthomonas sp.]